MAFPARVKEDETSESSQPSVERAARCDKVRELELIIACSSAGVCHVVVGFLAATCHRVSVVEPQHSGSARYLRLVARV